MTASPGHRALPPANIAKRLILLAAAAFLGGCHVKTTTKVPAGEVRPLLDSTKEALMAKYGNKEWIRPKGFFPRIDLITVYAIAIERMTGKETPLPPPSQQWPALDNTKTPNARP